MTGPQRSSWVRPSDFSSTCMSALRFMAFADRPWSLNKGALEISRFSRMVFSQRARVLRLRRIGQLLAYIAVAYCLPPTRKKVGILIFPLFEAPLPGPPMPPSLRVTPRDVNRKTRGPHGFTISFPAGPCTPTTRRFIPALSGLPAIRPELNHMPLAPFVFKRIPTVERCGEQ